jgi:hypothetical protein
MTTQKQTDDEHFEQFQKNLDNIVAAGKYFMPVISFLILVGLIFAGVFDQKPANTTVNVLLKDEERIVPATIYSTSHNVCGIITTNNVKLFAQLSSFPACENVKEDTAKINVTVVADENAINGWKVLGIAQRD